MKITPITTRTLIPPQDDLFGVLDQYVSQLNSGDVLCITAKVLSIHQGRCVPLKDALDKDVLITQSADMILPRELSPGGHAMHTITDGNLAVAAGIDASNGHGHYILWPENPSQAAEKIYKYLSKKFGITDLGIIITDSRSLPLRYGAIGCAIGSHGVKPLKEYAGTEDLFNRKLVYEQSNILDSIAAAAVLTMGEGDESKPLCFVQDIPGITFSKEASFEDLKVPLEEDIYYPFLKIFKDHNKNGNFKDKKTDQTEL